MLIICPAVKAVHLELVLNTISSNCFLALRRFITRRGVPNIIYSDNAKAFKCTAKEIIKLSRTLRSEEVQRFGNEKRIQWEFNMERASWWGGW